MAITRDRVGDVIAERYELLDVIGRGGQGMVYKGFDRWTERNVAIKLLAPMQARESQMAQRMIREQQALTALKGTAAVELLDVCRGSDGELCLVMELLSGTDLEEHLYVLEDRGERLDLYRVGEIFDPIVDTLEVAHNAGILHRDLKPANIYLLDYGGVRLLDFGLARMRTGAPLTAAGTVMGSPSYIAPEAWQGRTEGVDHRADVYSLGVILFRVLAGDLPFSGKTLHEKFLGSTKGERPSLLARRADLPPSADDWVEMALAIDREQRFSNVRALWNTFTETFGVVPPRRGKPRESIWSAAKHAIGHLTHGSDKPAAPPGATELAFATEALAKSVAPPPPGEGAPDILMDRARVAAAPPPHPMRPLPPAPRPPVRREATVELSELDLEVAPPSRRIEKTLELTDRDLLFVEDTIPGAPVPFPDVALAQLQPKPSKKERKSAKKRARAERRKQRKQARKQGK